MTRASSHAEAECDGHHAFDVAVACDQHADERFQAIEQSDKGRGGAVECADRDRGKACHGGCEHDGELAHAGDVDAEGGGDIGLFGDGAGGAADFRQAHEDADAARENERQGRN